MAEQLSQIQDRRAGRCARPLDHLPLPEFDAAIAAADCAIRGCANAFKGVEPPARVVSSPAAPRCELCGQAVDLADVETGRTDPITGYQDSRVLCPACAETDDMLAAQERRFGRG